jgi:cell division protein FtsB
MKILHFIPSFLRNKFLLTLTAFCIWMVFFDKDDLLMQRERSNELQKLEESKVYFAEQIKLERTFSEDLKTSPATIEKFAREKYLMKRDNEDLFIIQAAGTEENK